MKAVNPHQAINQIMNPLVKLGIVGLFTFTLIYAGFQARHLITGPEITLEQPSNGSEVANEAVQVSGFAENIAKLYLNGRQIFTNTTGHFDEEVLLAYGYNVLELVAEDKFGRTKAKTISLVFK